MGAIKIDYALWGFLSYFGGFAVAVAGFIDDTQGLAFMVIGWLILLIELNLSNTEEK